MTRRSERALCLFAGLGATAYGQTTIGNTVPYAIEYVDAFADTIEINLPETFVRRDNVKDLSFTSPCWEQVDVILGGPPCQPFSQANQNTLADADPRDCIPDFIRAVRNLRPRLFIMEEVKTLTYKRHEAYFHAVLSELQSLGYDVDFKVIDMSKHGVPQARKRLFIVGRNDGQAVQWPTEADKVVTMAGALGWTWGEATYAEAKARAITGAESADPWWVMERPSTTVVGSFRPEIQAAPGYRKAGDPPRQRTPGSVYLTESEALTLQGLPSDWELSGSEAQRRLQIGNSCPPTMTAQITLANDPIGV